ncbi:hypothetical protein SVAN01_07700 [Stagonosporopsis vannaccii]|nr:hypothetical protein SVAN01_07700 [Stagonosporopsis vannaccii]
MQYRSQSLVTVLMGALLATTCSAARQSYDVHKIIDAFRTPYDDLTILCAHRGLRWNGTTENSRESYFRTAQAGLECIETDIWLSLDGFLPMLHDKGAGRETDVGEQTNQSAYNPFTGKGYNPEISKMNFTGPGGLEHLHLRDDQGRVHVETVPTLPDIVQSIHDAGTDVVLQLDFKDRAAVAPTYWALKTLTNAAGVPANEWCIYKVQASWWKTPAEFEAQDWVQDAFASGLRIAHIPVYQPVDEVNFDTLASLKAFGTTNYTISAEIERRSVDGALQPLVDYMRDEAPGSNATFKSFGIFFQDGDLVEPWTTNLTAFDTANYTLPDDIKTNNSVYSFNDNRAPVLADAQVGNASADGRDWRVDFGWIVQQGHHWVIADIVDVLSEGLEAEGKRNVGRLVRDGEKVKDRASTGWYRRHARDMWV